jgi:hypothetical protein
MQWKRWTRRRRLKFRKRWRKQHGGIPFRWFISEFRMAIKPMGDQSIIFFQREPKYELERKAEYE